MVNRIPPQLYEIYLETSTIVDMDPGQRRNKHATTFCDRIDKYRHKESHIQLITSEWALTEALSVFYREELKLRQIPAPQTDFGQKDVRAVFPPNKEALAAANLRLESAMELLQSLGMTLYVPSLSDSRTIWQYALRLGQQAAIFPADSIHLAMAILRGCSMLVVTDFDFIDKAEYVRDTAVEPMRREALSLVIDEMPAFVICCLGDGGTKKERNKNCYRPAIAHLNELGFR